MEKIRCQSCGMPLGTGFYGTNADESETQEYCKFCFRSGVFTEPDLILPQMITRSIDHMIFELHFSEEKARALAEETIPKLRRWQELFSG